MWSIVAGPGRWWNRLARTYGTSQAPLRDAPGTDGRRRAQAVGAEVALVRAQLAALEPRADPSRDGQAPCLLPLAGPRQRARDAPRGAPRARRARAARA